VDRRDEGGFPSVRVESLSEEDKETSRRLAHKAIMGGDPSTEQDLQ